MGAAASINETNDISKLSPDEIGKHLSDVGQKFEEYKKNVMENGINGTMVSNLNNIDDIKVTMKSIGIESPEHQDFLLAELNKLGHKTTQQMDEMLSSDAVESNPLTNNEVKSTETSKSSKIVDPVALNADVSQEISTANINAEPKAENEVTEVGVEKDKEVNFVSNSKKDQTVDEGTEAALDASLAGAVVSTILTE